MALVKIQDGKKHLNNLNANSDTIAQNWNDALGKKVVNELQEVSTSMVECLKIMTDFELSIQQVTNIFLEECGGRAAPIDSDSDLASALLKELWILLESVTGDAPNEGSNASCYSASSGSEEDRNSYERHSNLDGTMLNGPAVYPQYDFDEYEAESGKVKRR